MPEIVSRSEARERGLKRYFTGRPCPRGHIDQKFVSSKGCLSCERIKNAARRESPTFRAEARRRSAEWRGASEANRRRNAENARRWRKANPERFRALVVKWQASNPEKVKAGAREHSARYRKANPEVFRLHSRSRDRRVSQATPAWVSRADIRAVYAACPEGSQVDHVIPIQGKTVCGLHVPENLQYLTPAANRSKGNRWSEWSSDGSDDSTLFPCEPFHVKGVLTSER